jgi:glycosyltransferase involved in cell wall biosynthesis
MRADAANIRPAPAPPAVARRRTRVVHVINSFESGGAEAMLCNLLLGFDHGRFESSVATLIDKLSVAGPVVRAGIPVAAMGMTAGVPDPRGAMRLAAHLRRLDPDVVQTWMDHSNLVGALAATACPRARVVWGVHHSDHVPGVAKRSTLLTVSACAALSRWLPSRVVYCSEHSRLLYARHGFDPAKAVVIPNGFDVGRFRPDPDARASVRGELGVPPNAPLVGLVARYDPFKDHSTFLRAAALLARARPDVHFLLCGTRVDSDNAELVAQVEALGLGGRCHLLGRRGDVQRIHAALDVEASSSISEAFPLVVGEAMACGTPCVVTDVGDSALIVGPTGRVVPPKDPAALAAGAAGLLAMAPDARAALGVAARRRVCERFDLREITRRYEALYEEIAPLPAPPRRPGPSSRDNPPASIALRGRLRPPAGAPQAPRVLMVVESSGGGTGRHVVDLCRGLSARGCEVHLLYSTGRTDRIFLEGICGLPDVRCTPLPMRRAIHPTDVVAVVETRRYLHLHGPFDAVHGHSSKGGAVARLAALGLGVPAFYTLHGFIVMDPELPPWKRALYWAIELALSVRTRRIIAVSPEERRAAVRTGLGRRRVALVANGVDATEMTPRAHARKLLGVGDEEVVVGFVGRFVTQKAPHVLVRAFARAAAAPVPARLGLVGAGPLEAPLRKLAEELGVADRVLWLGERDARTVMAGFDVFAISSCKEGLPYVVLEAMSAALPVVATDTAGVESLVTTGVNGRVVPCGDSDAFGEALAALIGDPDARARYGRASLQRVAEFSTDAMVDRTLALYTGAAQPDQAPVAPGPAPAEAFDEVDDLGLTPAGVR